MKPHRVLIPIFALLFLASLVIAQDKSECTSHSSCDGKTAALKSCCKGATGQKEASASIEASQSKIILVKDSKNSVSSTARATVHAKQCPMSSSSASGECTEAEKAACKAAMAKGSARMDCCKDKAKTVKAEKKSQPEKAEAKGTD